MTTKLITENVWSAIANTARRCKTPADVAVAYFGKGAAKLLKLPAGSRLVVDASEPTVKAGQTHPDDLQRMHRRKVKIYNVQNLHAKVFAFDKGVLVGSANASRHSANVLQEAVAHVGDIAIIRAARKFVKSLCLERLGPEELKRLQKLYRPPRFDPGQKTNTGPKQSFSVLRVALTHSVDVPEKLEKAFEFGLREATKKRKHKRGFYIEEFYWDDPSPFHKGQLIIQVHKSAHGKAVSPPGHVIHTRAYRNGKTRKTLIYTELPNRDWKPFSQFSSGAKKILARGGVKSSPAARLLLGSWEGA